MRKKRLNLTLVNCLLRPEEVPHMGLLSLSAYLRRYCPFVKITIVENQKPLTKILRSKPDIVGFTSDTIAINKTKLIAKKVKSRTKAKLIIGGVHITASPNSFGFPFDVGVYGEGEITLTELVNLFYKKGSFQAADLEKISGLVYLNSKAVKINQPRPLIKNIDSLPFATREIKNIEDYLKGQVNLHGVKRAMVVMTSRGCPYHCIYCGSPVQWGSVRFHSAEYVIEELRYLIEKKHIDGIIFFDDLFITPKTRLLKMVELIRNEGWDKTVNFTGFGRANLMDDEICQAVKKINIKKLTFGFESYSEPMLRYLKDNSVKVADNLRTIELCRKYGIAVASGLIVATPGERIRDLKTTYEFMKKYPMDNTQIYLLTPYPGTKAWNYALKKKLVSEGMDMAKLFVQIPLSASVMFWKKDRFDFLKDRIFMNDKMRHNKKYLNLILKMNSLAFRQNMTYYLKLFLREPRNQILTGLKIISKFLF